MNTNEIIETLLNASECGTLSTSNLETLVERAKNEMKRKEILNQHKPPIKQLPSGRWYTRLNGKKIEKTKKEDVEDIIVASYMEEQVTLASIFNDFLEFRKLCVADTTWSKDIRYFNTFIIGSELEVKAISKLDLDDGYTFIKHCKSVKPDLKRKYWDNINGFLNQFFQYAIDRRLIDNNPFANMRPKKDFFEPPINTRDVDTVFSKVEKAKVIKLAEEDSIKIQKAEPLGIVLLFNLGVRDGELCALKWSDIEQSTYGTYIHIQREMVTNINEHGKVNGFKILPHCKTPAGDRRLLLNDMAIDTLSKIKALNQARSIPTSLDDYILLRKEKDEIKNITPRSIDPRIRKYCKQANMDVIKSAHDIRRTVLTNLYEIGMPLNKIKEFAGHSSIQQTLDYIRVSDDDLNTMQYLNALNEPTNENIIKFSIQNQPIKKVEHS